MSKTTSNTKVGTVFPTGEGFTPSERGARATDEQAHYLVTRDFGSTELSGGKARIEEMRVVRNVPTETGWHIHLLDLQVFYVMKGTLDIEFADGTVHLEAGSCIRIPGNVPHRQLGISADAEMIELTMPAKFETKRVEAPTKQRVAVT